MKFQDCLKIVEYCAANDIETQLNSNASLLTPARIDQLADTGLTTLHISFNFTDAASFSRYYGMPEPVYHKIRENIAYSATTAIDTVLETLLYAETEHRLPEIADHVYRLGVRTHEIQNSIEMTHSGWKATTARDSLKKAVQQLIDAKREDSTLYFTCMDRFAEKLGFADQPGVYFSRCIEGKKQLHLHGNGDVLISELCYPVVIGNIYHGTSLKDLFTHMPSSLKYFLNTEPCPADLCH